MFLSLLIITIILTFCEVKNDKKTREYLTQAKKAYADNYGTVLYPKSEVILFERIYKYSHSHKLVLSSWLILISYIIFNYSELFFVIIFIVNYIYSRILNYLGYIECKQDIIIDKLFGEID